MDTEPALRTNPPSLISHVANARSARAVMVWWMLGLSASICVLAILALHRRAIDYTHADGARDALKNSSVDDTRYLDLRLER